MYQIHCPNCNSNRVDVAGKEIWVLLGIAFGIPGLIMLYLAVRRSEEFIIGALPLCLLALFYIYRFKRDTKAKCVCRKCGHKFVYNFR